MAETDPRPAVHSASVISARGRTKRPFDLKWSLKWEAALEGGATCGGVLAYTDVAPTGSGAAAPVAYEVSERFETTPPAEARETVGAGLQELKRQVDDALRAFAEEFGRK